LPDVFYFPLVLDFGKPRATMKNTTPSAAAVFLATAIFCCSPNNRYIESASLKRLPQGFAPILRNHDEKAGLEIGTGFGFTSSGPLRGSSKEIRLYETEKDEFGIERRVLTGRQFGRDGNFENHFPGFASHAMASIFTATPLGLHAEGAFSKDEGRTYYSYDLGLSITSAFRYFGFALFLKAGMGNVGGSIRYAETVDAIEADTIPEGTPLETLTFGDARQNRISAGGNVYLTANAMKSLSPFLGFAIQGYPLNVEGKKFEELLYTGFGAYAGARYSLTPKAGLLGLAGISGFDRFSQIILTSRLGLDYRVGW
jgi:hypothetical protein